MPSEPQSPATSPQPFPSEDDAFAVLSLFLPEAEVSDVSNVPVKDVPRAMPASLTPVTSESMAVDDLRGQIRQAEPAIRQSVDQAGAFKMELDQLRELARRLEDQYRSLENAARAADARRAETVNSGSAAVDDLRARVRQVELVIEHSVDRAGAFMTELDQLRELAQQLAGAYRRIDDEARAAEARRAEATNSESVAVDDLRGQLRQAELAIKQSVDQAGRFKTELDQLRELSLHLAGEFERVDETARAAEERKASATENELVAVDNLRGQLRQAELAIEQSVDRAGAFKTELEQLRELSLQLAGEYNRVDDASRAAEERRAEATKNESAAVDELRTRVRQAELALEQSVDRAGAFKTEIEQLREVSLHLAGEYKRVDEAARVAEERRAEATKNESVVVDELRGQLRQAELAIEQSVNQASGFRTELDQLRELASQLAGEYRRVNDEARAAEARRAEATKSESIAADRLRGQLRQAELAIEQSVDQAGAFKTELDRLREVASGLTAEYRLLEDTTRAADDRGKAILEILSAIESKLGPLATLFQRITSTETRLANLSDLAERKANRVAKLIAAMDALSARFEGNIRTLSESARSDAQDRPIENKTFEAIDLPPDSAEITPHHPDEPNTVRGSTGVRSVFSPSRRFVSAGSRLFAWWPARAVTPLQTLKARLITHPEEAVIGKLILLAVASLILWRVLGNALPIGVEPVMPRVQPALTMLTVSPVISPDTMVRTYALTLPQPTLIGPTSTQPPEGTATAPLSASAPVPSVPAPTPVRGYSGSLEVQSDPAGAAVFIDRERVGETPLQMPQLPVGSHVVWVELEGYQRWTTVARVVVDATTRVDVTLEPRLVPPTR